MLGVTQRREREIETTFLSKSKQCSDCSLKSKISSYKLYLFF